MGPCGRHRAGRSAARRGARGDGQSSDGAAACRIVRQQHPDVVVLDLAVRPSRSVQTARPLASARGPRLIVVGGTDQVRELARQQAPGATLTMTGELLAALVDG